MPKSRKAQAKTKDFQKVKLKIGKKLPKGRNETIATFKSTSIQIKEQFKQKDGSQPLTKKNRNIQELLTHCLHYSVSARTDALQGLLELVKSSPTILDNHISTVLERTSSMVIDKEYHVRQKGVQLRKCLFSLLSADQIAPFFPLISAHIICAMTHISEPIQMDSLEALDTCLEAYPDLMSESASKLLPCFVKQIATTSGKSAGKHVLLTNPSSKKSSQSWRFKVLQRMLKVLTCLSKAQSDSSADQSVSMYGPHAFSMKTHSCIKLCEILYKKKDDPNKLAAFIRELTHEVSGGA